MPGVENDLKINTQFPEEHGLALPISNVAPHLSDLSLDEYVNMGLEKGVVDAINAARLLASNATAYLSSTTKADLHNAHLGSDGEPIPNRIIAPLLRVGADFAPRDIVHVKPSLVSKWHVLPVSAVDEVDGSICLGKVILKPSPHFTNVIDPKYPALYTDRDYRILDKPSGRRPDKLAPAARFAIGLSFFDEKLLQRPRHVKSVLRIFELTDPYSSFHRES